jgi:sugar lactone lactonase YvrE
MTRMKMLTSRVVVDDLIYPEGIRWHQGKVWFSDILGFKVCTFDPTTGKTAVVVQLEDRPSGLGFLPDGRLLIATMGERKLLRLDPDGLKMVANLSQYAAILNDMVVDGHGRAYVDGYIEPGVRGGLILVEPKGQHRMVVDDMHTPNGLAVTPDGKTLIANDLMANTITAFDIAGDGSLANRRVFADLGPDSPDGLCLDAEGAAWVGQPFQNRVRRIKPGGDVTHEITYADRWGIAPVLGGDDRRTLYICTAAVTLEEIARLMHDPHAAQRQCRGWIESTGNIDIPGVGWP